VSISFVRERNKKKDIKEQAVHGIKSLSSSSKLQTKSTWEAGAKD
jgi:hypothetical protein